MEIIRCDRCGREGDGHHVWLAVSELNKNAVDDEYSYDICLLCKRALELWWQKGEKS